MFVKESFNSVSASWLSSLHHKGRYAVTWPTTFIPRLLQI